MMIKTLKRRQLSWLDESHLGSLLFGLFLKLRHLFLLRGAIIYEKKRSEATRSPRGMPYLVRDHSGNIRCVACQLCELVCPPKAIRVLPPGLADDTEGQLVLEPKPLAFEIDMTRCIYCGLCQEVCPEEAIFLSEDDILFAHRRSDLVFSLEALLRHNK